jgi:hypothetical protein
MIINKKKKISRRNEKAKEKTLEEKINDKEGTDKRKKRDRKSFCRRLGTKQ